MGKVNNFSPGDRMLSDVNGQFLNSRLEKYWCDKWWESFLTERIKSGSNESASIAVNSMAAYTKQSVSPG